MVRETGLVVNVIRAQLCGDGGLRPCPPPRLCASAGGPSTGSPSPVCNIAHATLLSPRGRLFLPLTTGHARS